MLKPVEETSIIQDFVEKMKQKEEIYIPTANVVDLLNIILQGAVTFVKSSEKFDKNTVIAYRTTEDNFVFGISLAKAEDDKGDDAYSISFLLDEDKFKELSESADEVIEGSAADLNNFVNNYLWNKKKWKLIHHGLIYSIFYLIFNQMIAFAGNVSEADTEDDGLVINFNDYLTLTVNGNADDRKIEIEPGTALKTFVKNDASAATE